MAFDLYEDWVLQIYWPLLKLLLWGMYRLLCTQLRQYIQTIRLIEDALLTAF